MKCAHCNLEEDTARAQWESQIQQRATQAEAARATARTAINHLIAMLTAPSYQDQVAADSAAREWLASIGADV